MRRLMEQFCACVEQGLIDWQLDFLEEEDISDYLEIRDSAKEFEEEWLRQYDRVHLRKGEGKNGDLVDRICRDIFVQVLDWSGSDDLAACISEDFELILTVLDTGFQDRWLNGMLKMYLDGRFPNDFDEVKEEGTEESIEAQIREYMRGKGIYV